MGRTHAKRGYKDQEKERLVSGNVSYLHHHIFVNLRLFLLNNAKLTNANKIPANCMFLFCFLSFGV